MFLVSAFLRHLSYASIFCQRKDPMWVQNRGKFLYRNLYRICIAFVFAQLKIFRHFHTKSESIQGLFLNGVLALTPKLLHLKFVLSVLADKSSVWRTFKWFEFLREGDGRKVWIFNSTLNPGYCLKMAEIKKNIFHKRL